MIVSNLPITGIKSFFIYQHLAFESRSIVTSEYLLHTSSEKALEDLKQYLPVSVYQFYLRNINNILNVIESSECYLWFKFLPTNCGSSCSGLVGL